MRKPTQINFQVDKPFADALNKIAKEKNITISELVRTLIVRYCDLHPKEPLTPGEILKQIQREMKKQRLAFENFAATTVRPIESQKNVRQTGAGEDENENKNRSKKPIRVSGRSPGRR